MHKFVLLVLCCLLGLTAAAPARGRYEKMKDCADLPTCMAVLDAAIASRDHDTELGDERQIALRLETFGNAAKDELLKRAVGPDRDWREFAAGILAWWPSFDEADIPALTQALQYEEGGWAAVPLEKFRTPAAIRALVADFGKYHFDRYQNRSFSNGIAVQFGKAGLPYVLAALEGAQNASPSERENLSRELAALLSTLGKDATPVVRPLARMALDRMQPPWRRAAALRGLAAIGERGAFVSTALHPLLRDSDPEIRKFTLATLEATHDPVSIPLLIPPLLGACRPEAQWDCSARLAAFGDALLPYDGRIENEYLYSQDRMDREAGASILGFVGYRPAIPRLVELLDDPDWRVVLAAVRSLGWLGARETTAALQKVAEDHWLPEVRVAARQVVDALQTGAVHRPGIEQWTDGSSHVIGFDLPDALKTDGPPCRSVGWVWQGTEFSKPRAPHSSVEPKLELSDGTFTGVVHQGFESVIGDLEWQPKQGPVEILSGGFVKSILPYGDGVIAIVSDQVEFDVPELGGTRMFGGHAVVATRTADGWLAHFVAEIPFDVDTVSAISQNLVVVWGGNRALVLSGERIQGMAECRAKSAAD